MATMSGAEMPAIEVLSPAGKGIEALAAALREPGSELVAHLPDGDELLPGALEKLGRAFAGRPDVVLVYPSYLSRDSEEEREVVPEEMSFTEMLMFQDAPPGPGAVFRRSPALAAAADSTRFGGLAMFSFWLRLAAAGGVLRLLEVLARRRVAGTPSGEPRELARERVDVLDAILAEVKLPDGREEVLRSAARSACVLAALEFEGGPQGAAERFSVADRFDLPDAETGEDLDARLASLEARIFALDQLNNRTRAVLPVLEEVLASREAHIVGTDQARGSLLGRLVRR
jgi:hypothetical protein